MMPQMYRHEFGTTAHGANPKLRKNFIKRKKRTASIKLGNTPHRELSGPGKDCTLGRFRMELPTRIPVGPSIGVISAPGASHEARTGSSQEKTLHRNPQAPESEKLPELRLSQAPRVLSKP